MILFLVASAATIFTVFLFSIKTEKKVWGYIRTAVLIACLSTSVYSGLRLREKYEVIRILPNNHVEAYRVDYNTEEGSKKKIVVETIGHNAHPGDILYYDGTLCICAGDYVSFD